MLLIILQIYPACTLSPSSSVSWCRRLLSREKEPLVNDVIRSGVVPKLVEFLSNDARLVQVNAFNINYWRQVHCCVVTMKGKWVSFEHSINFNRVRAEDLWIKTSCTLLKSMLCSKLTNLPFIETLTMSLTSNFEQFGCWGMSSVVLCIVYTILAPISIFNSVDTHCYIRTVADQW